MRCCINEFVAATNNAPLQGARTGRLFLGPTTDKTALQAVISVFLTTL